LNELRTLYTIDDLFDMLAALDYRDACADAYRDAIEKRDSGPKPESGGGRGRRARRR
jgi:hypothetical protein